MNTNNNLYTIVYSAVIVVVVAAILAWVAMALKPKQDANIKAETISQMLAAAQFASKEDLAKISNEQVLEQYSKYIQEAYLIDAEGKKVRDLDLDTRELGDDLKAQSSNLKKDAAVQLPVYIFNKDGKDVTILPVYGVGLWGPVWGYIAFDEDLKTIVGAYFDHESETPGLGAKIKDDPAFRGQFVGKTVDLEADPVFAITKNASADNQVDAITGATMTSKGLGAAIDTWLAAYKPYIQAVAPDDSCGCEEDCEEDMSCCEEEADETNEEE
ncbi:MAG: NADH:ubiquinone reductase (Na(+)-transporting) subunit C [Bacteroidales bacterium]|nr:NADH:ubiquinone reductase (Na(+)-transporting) subunit C [Bacteroidales bacterium]